MSKTSGLGDGAYPKDAWALLSPLMTEARQRRMQEVVQRRTRRLRLVIQDVHHPHNVSACMRSADAFGVQDVDVVTLKEPFKPSPVSKGVAPWLSVTRHKTVEACVKNLKDGGYRIACGLPTADATPLTQIPLDRPIAVVFGNEHAGVDKAWLDAVDLPFTIPMAGMVESLNISVSAAITLFHLSGALLAALGPDRYYVSKAEQDAVLCAWACRHTAGYEEMLKRLRESVP